MESLFLRLINKGFIVIIFVIINQMCFTWAVSLIFFDIINHIILFFFIFAFFFLIFFQNSHIIIYKTTIDIGRLILRKSAFNDERPNISIKIYTNKVRQFQ